MPDEAVAGAPATAVPVSVSTVGEDAEDDWPFLGASGATSSVHRRRRRHGDLRAPAATATLEDLFTGDHTTDSLGEVPPPKDKRKRRIGGWIALGVVLLLLGGSPRAGCGCGTPTRTGSAS